MRSRAPPVADAARRSIRSGRKNQASEQHEDFSGTARRQGLRLAEEDEKPGSQGESVGLRLAEALGE